MRKGLGNDLSVSLLKQTPATSGCPPFLAVLSLPTGIRSKAQQRSADNEAGFA